MIVSALIVAIALAAGSPTGAAAAPADAGAAPAGKWMQKAEAGKDLWATFQTSLGPIVVKLDAKHAPKTVANFVGLATGEKPWRNPNTGQTEHRSAWDDTIFHRVIPNFMIQGGDPTGTGRGDPGYTFEDETSNGKTFHKPGLLAMANRGPNTNGCQFFITVSTPQYLNGKHTIFGEVVSGYDVAVKISEVPRGRADRPTEDVKLKTIAITDKAPRLSPKGSPKPAKTSKQ